MNHARRRDIAGLVGFLLLSLGVSALGGLATSTSVGGWYRALEKPPFNPPDWVFAPVWTALFVLMAVAAWRIWRRPASRLRSQALLAYCVQLALNLLWSVLFFGLQTIGTALADIAALLTAIIVTLGLFWQLDRLAGILLLPYLAWVTFATVLNASLWILN